MTSFIDIIFLMIVVAVIFTRLYRALGTKSDNKNIQIVLKPVNKETEKQLIENVNNLINPIKSQKIDIESLTGIDRDLANIPNFDKNNFIRGAQKVFELVLKSFSLGDISSIKNLVSKKIFASLEETIASRKEQNLTSEVDFICFDSCDIKEVKKLKNSVKIIVEFVSEQVNILKDVEGTVIEGDENFIQKITDIWTFERLLDAKNNNWMLVSTKKS